MPLYDFKCDICKTIYEFLLSLKQFKKANRIGMPCSDECSGTCRPIIIQAPAICNRANLRIPHSVYRKKI